MRTFAHETAAFITEGEVVHPRGVRFLAGGRGPAALASHAFGTHPQTPGGTRRVRLEAGGGRVIGVLASSALQQLKRKTGQRSARGEGRWGGGRGSRCCCLDRTRDRTDSADSTSFPHCPPGGAHLSPNRSGGMARNRHCSKSSGKVSLWKESSEERKRASEMGLTCCLPALPHRKHAQRSPRGRGVTMAMPFLQADSRVTGVWGKNSRHGTTIHMRNRDR